jgi:hypothetical protein
MPKLIYCSLLPKDASPVGIFKKLHDIPREFPLYGEPRPRDHEWQESWRGEAS